MDIIKQKEEEIAELKKRLRYQDELINAFNTTEEDSDETPVDLDALRTKRYLFVGHTEENYPELNHALRSTFPDSIFMRSETDNIDSIQVDAVVLFLNWTSHGMYYKIKAATNLNGLPIVYCKSKNIDRIFKEMQDVFSE